MPIIHHLFTERCLVYERSIEKLHENVKFKKIIFGVWITDRVGELLDEFEFRLNNRDISDPERMAKMLRFVEGRMTYKQLIQK